MTRDCVLLLTIHDPRPTPQAELLESFLLPMLDFDPAHRAAARDCLNHPWLRDDDDDDDDDDNTPKE